MSLGTEVGLGPGRIVLDGDPAPLPLKRGTAPTFWPMSIVAKGRIDQDATWYEGRPVPRPHCVRWGPSRPQKNTGTASPPTFQPMSVVARWLPISATADSC